MTHRVPSDCRYAQTDEWVRVEGDGALIGISDYAQDHLSDIVFVDLPEVGKTFAAGKACGVVESVKAASDINAPVSGEVVAVNEDLVDSPEKINADPYASWIVRLKLTDVSELEKLMDAEAYAAYCESRD